MRIHIKLFLSIFAASLLLIVLMMILTRWSINQGMLDFIDTREAEKLRPLQQSLGQYYQQQGSWDNFRETPQLFRIMLRQNREQSAANDQLERPPGPPAGRHFRPFGRRFGLALLDQEKRAVIGEFRAELPHQLHPIEVDGRIVGWLSRPKPRQITEGFELQFIRQQQSAFVLIALVAMAVSALITLPLSRHLLKPIRTITDSIYSLSRGEFVQVEDQRSDELGGLLRDINQLSRTLENNETLRNRWLANTSHELRTPLAILRGEIELLIDGVRDTTDERLQSLLQEVLQLQKLIDDLDTLNQAEIGALRYQMEALDFDQLCKEVVERHRCSMQQAEIALHYQCDTPHSRVYGDSRRLMQLLDNLLQNTVKYTNRGGQAKIKLGAQQKQLQLTIDDSAPAVPDQAYPQLFEHLYRVEQSRNRETGGSGLGLAICRNIVNAHNGTISAGASPLGGLRITVTLPLLS